MPEYLVRFAQTHESFRKVELQALADVAGVTLDFVKYEKDVGLFSRSYNSRRFRNFDHDSSDHQNPVIET